MFRYDVNGGNESASKNPLYYGAYLPISRKVGDDWVEIEYISDENIGFDDVAYIIQENEETIYKYDWEWLGYMEHLNRVSIRLLLVLATMLIYMHISY